MDVVMEKRSSSRSKRRMKTWWWRRRCRWRSADGSRGDDGGDIGRVFDLFVVKVS